MSSRSKRSAAKDPASVTSESDHGKSKKSKTTTTKSQQHATKNDSIEPAGIVPSYRPSEWASPMISTNIKGARKSGRIIVQTEKGRKYYADSDNEEEEKISKPSIGGMGEASKARKNGGKKKGSSPSSAQPPSSKIVDSAADGGEEEAQKIKKATKSGRGDASKSKKGGKKKESSAPSSKLANSGNTHQTEVGDTVLPTIPNGGTTLPTIPEGKSLEEVIVHGVGEDNHQTELGDTAMPTTSNGGITLSSTPEGKFSFGNDDTDEGKATKSGSGDASKSTKGGKKKEPSAPSSKVAKNSGNTHQTVVGGDTVLPTIPNGGNTLPTIPEGKSLEEVIVHGDGEENNCGNKHVADEFAQPASLKIVAQELSLKCDAITEDQVLPASSSFSPPSLDDSLFTSEDFLAAIGVESQPSAIVAHEYANVGLSKNSNFKGGKLPPDKPDYDVMSPDTKVAAKKQYEKDARAFRDFKRREHRKECAGRSADWDKISYTGDNAPGLRTMELVQLKRLKAGDNFIDKDVVQLRIAEEANLRGIRIRWEISNNTRIVVKGDKFTVVANLTDARGWVVQTAEVRSGDNNVGDLDDIEDTDSEYEDNGEDDEGDDDDDDDYDVDNDTKKVMKNTKSERKLRSPLFSVWLVPLIKSVITMKPNTSNKNLRHLLRYHCRTYALTRALLQGSRDMAKLEVFGSKEENAKHFMNLRDELLLRNHRVELMMADYDEAVRRLLRKVVADETERRAEKNEQVFSTHEEAAQFAQQWLMDNDAFVKNHLGTKEDNCKFIVGILFAPVTSVGKVNSLQDLYQADAAHLDFGKYTFFSAYGSTANANAFPLAFGIMFGNEDKISWTKFWNFVKDVHGQDGLNHPSVTIITDQDKGSKGAIEAVLPHVANFHCSWHRRSNILKASSVV